MKTYDVAVIGLGAMGSAAAYQLASRGASVLGIEAFTPAHELGSSGGSTRIIRLAYFEHPGYVPLLRAAWELWPQIEIDSGAAPGDLLQVTGGLYVGRRGSGVLDGSLRSAQTHGLAHELLDADEARRRFPALTPDDDMQTLHEPLAGLLFAPDCIRAQLKLAEEHGAELHFEERVTGWSADGDGASAGLTITTHKGTYSCQQLVITAGAWLPKLAPELSLPLTVERNVVLWFEPTSNAEHFAPDRLPVWIMELDSDQTFYGFPAVRDQAVKVARHHGGKPVDPDTVDREVSSSDLEPVRAFIGRHMPRADGPLVDSRVCMYTNTPDFNFVLDFHPDDDRVLICSPCSGHGFKFSNIVGSIAADLTLSRTTSFDLDFLSMRRRELRQDPHPTVA